MKPNRCWSDHEPTRLGPLRVTYTPIRRRRLHAVDVFLGLLLLGLLIVATCLLGTVTP